jgi:hypothetical protein
MQRGGNNQADNSTSLETRVIAQGGDAPTPAVKAAKRYSPFWGFHFAGRYVR